MRLKTLNLFLLVSFVVILLVCGTGCVDGEPGDHAEKTILRIVPAGSLLVPFETLESGFEDLHPDVDVQVEGHGSIQCIRQVTDLHRRFDVVVVADESLIPDMMYIPMDGGGGNYSDGYTPFARNSMVIAYTNRSACADEITPDNWYEILSRPDVRVGFSNPMLDACGYRALMVTRMAQDYYGNDTLFDLIIGDHVKPPVDIKENGSVSVLELPEFFKPSDNKLAIRDGSIYLLYLLDSGGVDYAFEYRSVAEDHGLRWVDLPAELDMSSPEYSDQYANVMVKLCFQRFQSIGSDRAGSPIVYAVTIPNNAPNPQLAEEFVDYMVKEFSKGRPEWPEKL